MTYHYAYFCQVCSGSGKVIIGFVRPPNERKKVEYLEDVCICCGGSGYK